MGGSYTFMIRMGANLAHMFTLIPKVHLYISKVIYEILARATGCCCQPLDEYNTKRNYDNKFDAYAWDRTWAPNNVIV
jgi:hypothetical protein